MGHPELKRPSVLTLSTEAQAKAFLHPVRSKILQLIRSEARTITQTAKELGVHPANITHHFRILTKAGLIDLVERRDIGRTVENYYRSVADSFDVSPVDGMTGANAKVLTFLRNDLGSALKQLKADDSESLVGLIKKAKLTKEQFDIFAKKLLNLLRDLETQSSAEGIGYTLNVSLYPMQTDHGPLNQIHIRKKKRPHLKEKKTS